MGMNKTVLHEPVYVYEYSSSEEPTEVIAYLGFTEADYPVLSGKTFFPVIYKTPDEVNNHLKNVHKQVNNSPNNKTYDINYKLGFPFTKLSEQSRQEFSESLDQNNIVLHITPKLYYNTTIPHPDGTTCTGTMIFLGGLLGTIFGYLLHTGGVF